MASVPRARTDQLRAVIERHWGYRTFRPLQERAMTAVLDGRDSLVVLPTGAGKSLCYQAPAVCRGDTTVVLSPLIALMKDQVDGLRACGVPAAQIDSSLSALERSSYEQEVLQGAVRLLFISPERLVNTDFYRLLERINVRTFAIDEAHCISHWGHDFRPEYRQLRHIKERFPGASVHAYTATATEKVRADIIDQLGLTDPEVLVGNFDRANLTYRVLPRHDRLKQVLEVLERHPGEAGIIYCPFQRDVEELTAALRGHGLDARRYHAGLSAEERKTTQGAFADEECNLIVATVAFGMGIDRSNLRFVIHTGTPKSLEHYQQETGRAGRDGLPAECVLLHSGADVMMWKGILEKNAEEARADPSFLSGAVRQLNDIDRYARGVVCRHRALVEHFGQSYPNESCGACDLCLGDTEPLADSLVVAQKILSCVARLKGNYGIAYVIAVLRGQTGGDVGARVRQRGHDQLSTFGLFADRRPEDLRDWIYQLLGQKALVQQELVLGDGKTVPVLGLNEASWEVMRGEREVKLLQLVRRKRGEKAKKAAGEEQSWEGLDRGLFEELRTLRRTVAAEKSLQPYLVFGDRTLREMARVRPTTLENLRGVYGVGEAKQREYGERFVAAITTYCRKYGVAADQEVSAPAQLRAALVGVREEPPPTPPPARAASPLPNSVEVAQKILSCVARVGTGFDARHVVRVLRGSEADAVTRHGHEKLSTYGLLRDHSAEQIDDWVTQLLEQKALTAGTSLGLNATSWAVMRGQAGVKLYPLAVGVKGAASEEDPAVWDRVDRELFAALEAARDHLAAKRKVETKTVVHDWVLRELARVRPSTAEKMRLISGLGDATLAQYGHELLAVIQDHCRSQAVPMDQPPGPAKPRDTVRQTRAAPEERARAFALYGRGASVEDVIRETDWSRSKAVDYLCEYLRQMRPVSLEPWVAEEVCAAVAAAARRVGTERLKPIYLALGERVPYDTIRLVLAVLVPAH